MRRKTGFITLLIVVFALLISACDGNQVPENEIRAKLNPNYDPRTNTIEEKYLEIKAAGEEYDDTQEGWVTLQPARIESPNIGIYGTQYLPPGTYPKYPSVDVQVVPGTNVPADYIGVYLDTTVEAQEYRVLQPGIHYVPADWVTLYPSSLQRYRTLGGNAWETYQSGDISPCLSLLCEFSITSVGIADTDVLASVDVDVQFKFCSDQRCASRLVALGGPEQAVQNWLATPLRSFVRSGFNYTAEQLTSVEVRGEVQELILTYLQTTSSSEPITFESVSIRSIVVGSEDYRAALEESANRLEEVKRQGDLLAQQQANHAIEMSMTATTSAFERGQELLNTQSQADELAILIGVLNEASIPLDWQTVMALLNAGNPNWLTQFLTPAYAAPSASVPIVTPAP